MVDRELLARSALFAGLTPAELDVIVAAAARRELRRGDVLFAEGDDSEELFVVEAGRVAMSQRSVDGRESVSFLVRVKELLEDPMRLLLGV